ncbi:myoneurin-like [Centruroides vittatus]|uniref:myoneurin-like n=1 Tax=Centruroides vittatus TaxID=120091 RepID=UPI00350F366C
MGTEQFCLRWDNHKINLLTGFDELLSNEVLVDVTLACEGLSLKAHKIVLSACSPFFQALFIENPCKHPIVIMKDVKYTDLKAMIDFIYKGEINVTQQQLTELLKTAEILNIKGLVDIARRTNEGEILFPVNENTSTSPSTDEKKKIKRKRSSVCSGNSDSPTKIREIESSENDKDLTDTFRESENNMQQVSSDSSSLTRNKEFDESMELNNVCHNDNCKDNSQLEETSELDIHEIQEEVSVSKEEINAGSSESLSISSNLQSDKDQNNSEDDDDDLDDSQEEEDGKNKKIYKCCKCEKQFKNSSTLRRHERIHSGEKLHTCEICKQGFNQRSYLKTHMMTHTGEKPFKCDVCDQRFAQKSNLKQHLLIHSGDKPFTCDTCKQTFNRMETLRKHTRTHTGEKPFQCEICKENFSRKEGLKKHILLHTGEKPFSCHICKRRFTQPYNLYSHLKTYNNEKPFVCEVCKKGFSRKYNLKQHMILHDDNIHKT